jgi:hypothetical protein
VVIVDRKIGFSGHRSPVSNGQSPRRLEGENLALVLVPSALYTTERGDAAETPRDWSAPRESANQGAWAMPAEVAVR